MRRPTPTYFVLLFGFIVLSLQATIHGNATAAAIYLVAAVWWAHR